MSVHIYDAASNALLVPPGAAITSDTTYPAILAHAHLLPSTAWVLCISAINATGTYSFVLEASDVEAGPYTLVSRLDWPTGMTGTQEVALGVNASTVRMSTLLGRVRYLRVRAAVGGVTPSVTFRSWLSKHGGSPGLASRSYSLDHVNGF